MFKLITSAIEYLTNLKNDFLDACMLARKLLINSVGLKFQLLVVFLYNICFAGLLVAVTVCAAQVVSFAIFIIALEMHYLRIAKKVQPC